MLLKILPHPECLGFHNGKERLSQCSRGCIPETGRSLFPPRPQSLIDGWDAPSLLFERPGATLETPASQGFHVTIENKLTPCGIRGLSRSVDFIGRWFLVPSAYISGRFLV